MTYIYVMPWYLPGTVTYIYVIAFFRFSNTIVSSPPWLTPFLHNTVYFNASHPTNQFLSMTYIYMSSVHRSDLCHISKNQIFLQFQLIGIMKLMVKVFSAIRYEIWHINMSSVRRSSHGSEHKMCNFRPWTTNLAIYWAWFVTTIIVIGLSMVKPMHKYVFGVWHIYMS